MSPENVVSELETTLRELDSVDLHFVYVRLVAKGFIHYNISYVSDAKKLDDIISIFKYSMNANIDQIILGILNERATAVMPKAETEWIDVKNERLCVFLWLSVQKISPKYFPPDIYLYNQQNRSNNCYPSHLMPMNPSNAASCIQLVFDFFYIHTAPLDLKIQGLRKLRQDWEKTNKFKHKMLKALEQDNDQVTQWFWEYSRRLPAELSYIPIDFDTFREKLRLVQAFCDCLNLEDADKTLALNKAYSAFHAKKFKEKPKNLKGANFWLGPEQIRMLNEIAWRKKLSEKDALYSLVNDAYLKIIK